MRQCSATAAGANNGLRQPEVQWTADLVTPDNLPYGDAVGAFCRKSRLTPREAQTVHMICSGMSNAEMAAELGVSNATVRLHIGNIHRKLGTKSKVDLVVRIWSWSMVGQQATEPCVPPPYLGRSVPGSCV